MSAEVLVVTDGPLSRTALILASARRGGFAPTLEKNARAAFARLEMEPRPVVLDAQSPGAEWFLRRVRGTTELATSVVIVIVPEATSQSFAEAHSWGATAVIPAASLGSLTRSLEGLKAHAFSAEPPPSRGTAVVAAQDSAERLARGCPLRGVGYDVLFAATEAEVVMRLTQPGVVFALLDASVFPTGLRGLAECVRATGFARPVIAIVSEEELAREDLVATLSQPVQLLSRTGPPDDAIFVANALLRGPVLPPPESPRLLHATLASFATEQAHELSFGMTYNISASGLFVRTLAPPAVGETVWIAVTPPGSTHALQLEAQVMWTRALGPSSSGASPAGFGAKITGGSAASLMRWRAGYIELLQRFKLRGQATGTIHAIDAGIDGFTAPGALASAGDIAWTQEQGGRRFNARTA